MKWTRLAASLTLATIIGLTGCGVIVDRRADRQETEAEAEFPPEGQFVEVDGRRVHVVIEGKGPDLVLIHGASGSTRDFTFSFVDQIKDRYRVLVFDRPGLGYTDRFDPSFTGAFKTVAESPAQQARLLQAAAAKLGADKPIVLGHSYGGAVALAWALERPDNLSGLVVLSGASNPWPGGLGTLYAVASSSLGGAAVVPLLTAFPPEGQVEQALTEIFAPQPITPGYADYVGIGLTLRRETIRANARQVNGLRPFIVEMSERYGEIKVPTEIVHGTDDDVVPLRIHADPLSRQIPGANLTQLDGIGHMPHQVAPKAVIAAIDRASARARLR